MKNKNNLDSNSNTMPNSTPQIPQIEDLSLQSIIMKLQQYWSGLGCAILTSFDQEIGAGTLSPYTALHAVSSKNFSVCYVQISSRPTDASFGSDGNRLSSYYQFQVLLKPEGEFGNIQNLFLSSLERIGIDLSDHDIKFVEDDWKNESIGAYGLGYEVWCNGMEIAQFTHIQSIGGIQCKTPSCELTYGLERIAMYVQGKASVFDIDFANSNGKIIQYEDIHSRREEYARSSYVHNYIRDNARLHSELNYILKECPSLIKGKRIDGRVLFSMKGNLDLEIILSKYNFNYNFEAAPNELSGSDGEGVSQKFKVSEVQIDCNLSSDIDISENPLSHNNFFCCIRSAKIKLYGCITGKGAKISDPLVFEIPETSNELHRIPLRIFVPMEERGIDLGKIGKECYKISECAFGNRVIDRFNKNKNKDEDAYWRKNKGKSDKDKDKILLDGMLDIHFSALIPTDNLLSPIFPSHELKRITTRVDISNIDISPCEEDGFMELNVDTKSHSPFISNVNYPTESMILIAYRQCLRAGHILNILDARGVLSAADRRRAILDIRDFAKKCIEAQRDFENYSVNKAEIR